MVRTQRVNFGEARTSLNTGNSNPEPQLAERSHEGDPGA